LQNHIATPDGIITGAPDSERFVWEDKDITTLPFDPLSLR